MTYSEQPHNPWNILEAADGSDDDTDYCVLSPAAMDIDADANKELEEDEVKFVKAPEEDDEDELGPLSGLSLVLSKVPHKSPIKLLHKNKVKLGTVQLAVL